jgi:hypothetical protein
MTQQLPVSMHPRYQEFLGFMADCPHRKTPEIMEATFWAWLTLHKQFADFFESTTKKLQVLSIDKKLMKGELDSLKNDLDRLHRERDSFQQQARVLAEEVERLNNLFLVGFNQAVGERGDACLSIDGGNL